MLDQKDIISNICLFAKEEIRKIATDNIGMDVESILITLYKFKIEYDDAHGCPLDYPVDSIMDLNAKHFEDDLIVYGEALIQYNKHLLEATFKIDVPKDGKMRLHSAYLEELDLASLKLHKKRIKR